MLPRPTYSNCPLAVLYLCLRGRAARIVATRTPLSYFPWHLGGELHGRVLHFKRLRDGQPWAPFYFEGRMLHTRLTALERTGKVLWIRPAWCIVPPLLLLVVIGLPLWMLVAALYWPWWLARGAVEAICRW